MDYKYKKKSKFTINDMDFVVEFERKGCYIWASTVLKNKTITAFHYNKEDALLNLKQSVYMVINFKNNS